MADRVTPEKRSAIMRAVRSVDTRPELKVRRLLHSMGYRYRLHDRHLPGNPDIIFPRRRKVIFVHGCFWHRHEGCALATTPSSRTDYWLPKFEQTKLRDAKNLQDLSAQGWQYLIVWECQIKNTVKLAATLKDFLATNKQVPRRPEDYTS